MNEIKNQIESPKSINELFAKAFELLEMMRGCIGTKRELSIHTHTNTETKISEFESENSEMSKIEFSVCRKWFRSRRSV